MTLLIYMSAGVNINLKKLAPIKDKREGKMVLIGWVKLSLLQVLREHGAECFAWWSFS